MSLDLLEPLTEHFAETMADVLTRLGDIPPNRILWNPTPGTATVSDLLSCSRKGVELIDGTLVEKSMGAKAGFLEYRLLLLIGIFVERQQCGRLFSASLMTRVHPEQIRLPDVSFYSWARWPSDYDELPNIMPETPDLAIEVLSDSNTPAEMLRKREEFFAAGTRLFWIVDPEKKTVTVYTTTNQLKVLQMTDYLDGGEVLPGFRLNLSELFGR